MSVNFTSSNNLKSALVNSAAGGTLAAIAAVTGKKIKVYAVLANCASSTTVEFKSATTSISGPFTMTGLTLDPLQLGECVIPWFQTAAGEALNIVMGGAVQFSAIIKYTDCD